MPGVLPGDGRWLVFLYGHLTSISRTTHYRHTSAMLTTSVRMGVYILHCLVYIIAVHLMISILNLRDTRTKKYTCLFYSVENIK